MRYGKYYVSAMPDSGIERENPETGKTELCKGYFCQVYTDENYENEVDSFCLAVGHEISDDSDKALDKGIRWYLDISEQEEQQREKEAADLITAEDLVEQAVYAANAPNCCSGSQQAANMLGMLGANVMDGSIYHSEDEHPTLKM